MLPPDALPQRAGWREQQRSMLEQYRELAADREHAILAYRSDYDPLSPVLAELHGRVVDVGGGAGLARHWLSERAHHLVVEPESGWLGQGWQRLADALPGLARPTAFVRGIGERLPLRDACADAVLSIFHLNHAVDPRRSLAEMARVLGGGGRLVLVLDDVAPRWGDLAPGGTHPVRGATHRLRLRLRWLWTRLVGHRVQPDHLPIRERDLDAWAAGLELVERRWRGAYLCRVYVRRESPAPVDPHDHVVALCEPPQAPPARHARRFARVGFASPSVGASVRVKAESSCWSPPPRKR